MQIPHFAELVLDLRWCFLGTLNVSIAPNEFEIVEAPLTFRDVKWCETEPAEDFSFFDCEIRTRAEDDFARGIIYYPHPETKPEHFQPPDVLEVLTSELPQGSEIELRLPSSQIRILG